MTAPINIVFYDEKAWDKLNAIMPVAMSYADYLRSLRKTMLAYAAHGIKVKQVPIDVDAMIAWCHRNGCDISDKARAAYCDFELVARNQPVLDLVS
jgi:hypothetical protein